MFSRFSRAIVRPPSSNFAEGLTTIDQGPPDFALARHQHGAYCDALERHGCTVLELPEAPDFPDATFVEDTALILPSRGAILTRPGAESRQGEVELIRPTVLQYFLGTPQIEAPGTLDAGDVCEVGERAFIGLSERTNEEGARQLSEWMERSGVSAVTIDIRTMPGILHLKSGVTALDERTLLAIDALADHPALAGFDVIRVPAHEAYAANCVRVNDAVFFASGFPETQRVLESGGFTLELLEMSEFAKMDGGLTCLSLRF